VLLSDVDVIWLANPFNFLVRDSDVEGMSDGWDDPTTFGWDYAGAPLGHSSRRFISAICLGNYAGAPLGNSSRTFISAICPGVTYHPAMISPYLGAYRLFARNSGMFYVSATKEVQAMMTRLARRMETETTWDQTAYNEEQFYPAYGTHGAVGVSTRAMHWLCNMNSKTFFRFVRDDAELLKGYRPISVHVR